MPIDVSEATFESEVVERSRQVPVVVDFWAEWCGPCRTLGPALEAAEAARGDKVVLAKVDVDSNQALAARFGVQGIPAVKAFRDGAVVDEFVGAVPREKVEQLFDSLAPSRADELLERGDELSLREAAELEPRRADVAVALARARLRRGATEEALDAVRAHSEDFAAAGIAARISLAAAGIGEEAFAALDRDESQAAIEALLAELANLDRDEGGDDEERAKSGGDADVEKPPGDADRAKPGDDADRARLRDELRRAIVGILAEFDPADPAARAFRRRLSAAL